MEGELFFHMTRSAVVRRPHPKDERYPELFILARFVPVSCASQVLEWTYKVMHQTEVLMSDAGKK